MVTSRSLRRAAHRNPAALKVAAGLLAGAVGMTTAAYGVFHIVEPFKGNGARSEHVQEEEPGSPTDELVGSLLDIVFAELPADGTTLDTTALLGSLGETADLVASIVDATQPSLNGVISPGTGNGGEGGGNGGNGPLIPWNGGTITPPSGGGDRDLVLPRLGDGPSSPSGPSTGDSPNAVPTTELSCLVAPPAELAPVLGGPQTASADEDEQQAPAEGGEDDGSEEQAPPAEEAPAADGCSAPAPVQLS